MILLKDGGLAARMILLKDWRIVCEIRVLFKKVLKFHTAK